MRGLLLALAIGSCIGCAGLADWPAPQVADVGRVEFKDINEGYIVATFPRGPVIIAMDKREMGHYIPGDEIRIDSFGRPLPR